MRRTVLILLAIASIAFLAHAVRHSYLSVERVASFVSLSSFTLALIPGTIMLIIKTFLHVLITEDILEQKTNEATRSTDK